MGAAGLGLGFGVGFGVGFGFGLGFGFGFGFGLEVTRRAERGGLRGAALWVTWRIVARTPYSLPPVPCVAGAADPPT
jgi:hypothetical protein